MTAASSEGHDIGQYNTNVTFDVADSVGTVTFRRPEAKNALSQAMLVTLSSILDRVNSDAEVSVLVITGVGDAFSTGHDLKEMSQPGYQEQVSLSDIYSKIRTMKCPTIAAINGTCLAGGSGVALNTDLRVMAESATFGWPQVRRGIASVSGPAILSRLIPPNIALEYLLSGKSMTASTAFDLNLVNRVVPLEQLGAEVSSLAGELTRNAAFALRVLKRAVVETRDLTASDALVRAQEILDETLESEGAQEGLRAFVEKRSPNWEHS